MKPKVKQELRKAVLTLCVQAACLCVIFCETWDLVDRGRFVAALIILMLACYRQGWGDALRFMWRQLDRAHEIIDEIKEELESGNETDTTIRRG